MAIPLVPCIIMLISTYVTTQSIFLLRDPEFFGVDESELGTISSLLVLVGLPGAMIGTFMGGFIFDIFGRRFTLFMSFLMSSVLTLTIPYTAPSIVPSLLIVRLLINFSNSMPSSNPLLADYVHKDAIGKAATLVGVGFIVGEVLSMAVLFPMTQNMTRYNAFLTAAIVGVACSIMLLFLVKEPQLRKSLVNDKEEVSKKEDEIKVA